MANALRHESSGSKLTGSPGPHAPSVNSSKSAKGSIIGDENVEPPSTLRVGFHTVEEAAVAVLDQALAKSVAAGVCSPVGGTPRLHHRPPICRSPPAAPMPEYGRCGNWPTDCRQGWRGRSSCRYLAGWPRNPVPNVWIGDFGAAGRPWLAQLAAPGCPGRLEALWARCRAEPGGIYSQALARRSQPGPKGSSHLHSTGNVKLPQLLSVQDASARALLTSALP